MNSSTDHVVFVQFGDFRAASHRLRETGEERYQAQGYSVRYVEALRERYTSVTVVCVKGAALYDEMLPSGVRAIGLPEASGGEGARGLMATLDRLGPTELILRTPNLAALRHALARGIPTLPCLADSFQPRPGLRGLLDRMRIRALGAALADPRIAWVSNHNVAASRDLARIGVPADKIVPWDWPRAFRPEDYTPRTLATDGEAALLCLGAVSEAKGVGDAIRALAASSELARRARLTVVGGGDIEAMRAMAASLGVGERVRFTGPVPFADVAPTMRAHDILIVYTRPAYGEGMPGTIYEGLATRLPLVVSDHPMFLQYLVPDRDAAVAPAADPPALAATLLRLLDDPTFYARLSSDAPLAYARIEHPVFWGDVLTNWLRHDAAGDAWLSARRLPVWPDGPRREASTTAPAATKVAR